MRCLLFFRSPPGGSTTAAWCALGVEAKVGRPRKGWGGGGGGELREAAGFHSQRQRKVRRGLQQQRSKPPEVEARSSPSFSSLRSHRHTSTSPHTLKSDILLKWQVEQEDYEHETKEGGSKSFTLNRLWLKLKKARFNCAATRWLTRVRLQREAANIVDDGCCYLSKLNMICKAVLESSIQSKSFIVVLSWLYRSKIPEFHFILAIYPHPHHPRVLDSASTDTPTSTFVVNSGLFPHRSPRYRWLTARIL